MAFIRPGGFRILLLLGVLLALIVGAGGAWFYSSFLSDLPDLRSIEDFRPPLASRVLDRNGTPIGEFYKERRSVAPLETIPQHTRLAFVAAEDNNFFEHAGIDYVAIIRAAWTDLRARKIKEGASTITMQLVKQLLLSPERKFRRKLREMILAKQIESRFTKDEILYLYLNQIYFGHGAWGIAAAARAYFDKDVRDLTISESAMLAGLPQRPSEYSPFRDPEAAEVRRRSVIGRMLNMEAITPEQAEEALADVPVMASPELEDDYRIASYFTEEVRRYLYDRLGGDSVLEGGLVIETTLDIELQRAAVAAIEAGLIAHDHRYGYRGPLRRVARGDLEAEILRLGVENELIPDPEEVAESKGAEGSGEAPAGAAAEEGAAERDASDLPPPSGPEVAEGSSPEPEAGRADAEPAPLLPADETLVGVVTEVDGKAQRATVAFAPEITAEVFLEDVDWAHAPNPKQWHAPVRRITDIFREGHVAKFRLLADGASKAPYPGTGTAGKKDAPEEAAPLRVELYQEPQVEGALLSFDIATGDVIAMVGGRDYENSEFNRATQATRQPGSAFKPFIYGAALSRGYTPVSTIYDRPLVINDPELGSWKPRNYGRRFHGPMPMRRALAKSVNNATVHLFRDVGVDYVIDYARRLGIQSPLSRDLTLALGSSDVSLLELTTAYAVFPNGGRRLVPRFITKVTDRDGEVLLEDVPLGTPPPPVLKPLADPDAVTRDHDIYPDSEILPSDQIISTAQAFLMCDLLKAVVEEGTGRAARQLPGYVGGKTGTTNDQADAWFMGFSPDVATGVWVGYDSVKLLGWGETGAKAALPIWRDFMRVALEKREVRDFEAPEEIVFQRVDRETGLLADEHTKDAYFQPFLEGTAPTEFSSRQLNVTDTRRALREDAFQ